MRRRRNGNGALLVEQVLVDGRRRRWRLIRNSVVLQQVGGRIAAADRLAGGAAYHARVGGQHFDTFRAIEANVQQKRIFFLFRGNQNLAFLSKNLSFLLLFGVFVFCELLFFRDG